MIDKITTYIKVFHEDPPLETYVVQVQICRLTHRQSQNLKNALIFAFWWPANGNALNFRCSWTEVHCAAVLERHQFRLTLTRISVHPLSFF